MTVRKTGCTFSLFFISVFRTYVLKLVFQGKTTEKTGIIHWKYSVQGIAFFLFLGYSIAMWSKMEQKR